MQEGARIIYNGIELNSEVAQSVRSLANQSNHPLSKAIVSFLPFSKSLNVKEFKEVKGKGICGTINGQEIILGSPGFINGNYEEPTTNGSYVYLKVNHEVYGCFIIKNEYRTGLKELTKELTKEYELALISGDNDGELQKIQALFGNKTSILFNQKPEDKLAFIKGLQQNGKKVIMIGDGLNDAGALRQSDVGIAITDNVNNFSPACDVILSGDHFIWLSDFIEFCKKEKPIIYGSFIISVLYNIIGLFYAVQGTLKPVIAAILMPASSISIVLFTTGLSSYYYLNLKKKISNHQTQHV
jgi:Cu+-exporting ATPase